LLLNTNALHCIYRTVRIIQMSPKKTTTLNLRVDPAIKEAIKEAANREHRSVANMIEMLIRQHCAKKSITVHDQHGLFNDDE